MDREAEAFTCPTRDHKVFYRMLRELGDLRRRRAATTASVPHRRPAHPGRTGRPLPAALPPGPRPARGLPARTPARVGLHQPEGPGLLSGATVLGRPRTASPRHRQPAPAQRRRRRVEAASADQTPGDHLSRTARSPSSRWSESATARCLTPVRAFYLDLCPVGDRGSRPVGTVGGSLPGRSGRDQSAQVPAPPQGADGRAHPRTATGPAGAGPDRRRAAQERHRGSCTPPATPCPARSFTVAGQTLTRSITRTTEKVWADDPATGSRRDLGHEEDHAFWAWAAVEVLRLTGCRVEELLEISHHSLIQYRLPTTGEIVPLLQIVPSKTDEERLLVVSPELADVLSTVIRRIREPDGTVPLVAVYDRHECVWRPPAPVLFQRRFPCRDPGDQRQLAADHAQRRSCPHRPDRSRRRTAPALHAARLPKNLHHRRRHERPATAHRPDHRRPPRHQRHPGLQGRLPRRGDPGPPGVPRPPPGAAPHRGIPHPHRRGMGGIPRPLRAPQGLHRHLRSRVRHPLHPRTRLPAMRVAAGPTPPNGPASSRSATTSSPASPKPNAKAGSARSKASRSASPAPKTNSPRSTNDPADTATSALGNPTLPADS